MYIDSIGANGRERMKLTELAGSDLELPNGAGAIAVSGITSDSRKVSTGFLFFALAGSAVDGAGFAGAAADKGAAAIFARQDAKIDEQNVPVIRVDDPRRILAIFASRIYPRQPETMVAVTGTAGKTSVATFTRQIWDFEGKKAASLGTTGVVAPGRNTYGNLTTPDPVDLHGLLDELASEGVTHAAMEASSHGLDQRRLDGVNLSAAAFTNLGRDHMDYHATVADYMGAKMRLFAELLPSGAPAIIFADDAVSEEAAKIASGHGADVRTVGRKGEFVSLKKVEHQQFNQIVEVSHDNKSYRIEFPLAGDFQIANGLVSAGLAIATGTPPDIAFAALEQLKGASGRLELVGKNSEGSPAYVDYAHKPDALEQVLKALRPFTTGILILVIGCGGDRDPGKRPIMGEIAVRLADLVIVTDDNPRTEDPQAIRSQIMAAAEGATEIGDREEAIHYACAMLKEGDCLVVAGKGHEEGQIVGSKVLPFSDHQVLRDAMGLAN